ncbi:MAG: DsrE family protein [Deltaproteobacteria bacterium]|nr:DsrE family protein [Deltaproteobacteria bacterium]
MPKNIVQYFSNKYVIAVTAVCAIIIGAFVIIGIRYGRISLSQAIKTEKIYGGVNKKLVIKDLKLEKEYKAFIPFKPVGNYDGKLKKTGTVKIVFGVSGGDVHNFYETMGNVFYIFRYVKSRGEKAKIRVVFYGKMVKFLNPQRTNPKIIKMMKEFYDEGVRFYACYNALMINHLVKSNLPYYIKPVPMGALRIYLFVKRGYVYITNP